MIRVQIQLDPAQHRRIKRRAKRLGVSVAEVMRRWVDTGLASEAADAPDDRMRRALAVAGTHADLSGATDVARHHDAALAEAYRR